MKLALVCVAVALAGVAGAPLAIQSSRVQSGPVDTSPAPDPTDAIQAGRVVRFFDAALPQEPLLVRERRGTWAACAPTEDAIIREAGEIQIAEPPSTAPEFARCRTFSDWIVALDDAKLRSEESLKSATKWASNGGPGGAESVATATELRDATVATYDRLMGLVNEAADVIAAGYAARPYWINLDRVTGFRLER
jgi:hypothetical protein